MLMVGDHVFMLSPSSLALRMLCQEHWLSQSSEIAGLGRRVADIVEMGN